MATTNVGEELRTEIGRFIGHELSLESLKQWRRAHIDELVQSDEATQTLHDALALLLAEHAIGDRDEAAIRAALVDAFPELATRRSTERQPV